MGGGAVFGVEGGNSPLYQAILGTTTPLMGTLREFTLLRDFKGKQVLPGVEGGPTSVRA